MEFFEKLEKAKGGYIFLSHSHEDIGKVRKIRNDLENEGFEPLCFYLKCLDDDNSVAEIKDLIKREIDAREWFVFINSENSRKSEWVAFEREHITKTNSKKIITIDIDDDEEICNAVEKIAHNLRVFLSCSHMDGALAHRLKEKLTQKDYLVWTDKDVTTGGNWAFHMTRAVVEASQEGCVIALLTPNSLRSRSVTREILLALDKGGKVIPVVVGDVELDGALGFMLSDIQHYRLSENPTDRELDAMIDSIGHAIVK